MGRTIPSFRQLLEIERLDWSDFKKTLPTKKDKQTFDAVFENAKLYTSYLSNAVNPIIFESVVLGHLFRNYKELVGNSQEEDKVNEDVITKEIKLLTENKPHGKILFDRTCKKWKGFIDALHMEDRHLLLKMILEICNYNEYCNMVVNSGDSESCITYFFFFAAIMQLQKRIIKINENLDIKNKTNMSLLDFLSG